MYSTLLVSGQRGNDLALCSVVYSTTLLKIGGSIIPVPAETGIPQRYALP